MAMDVVCERRIEGGKGRILWGYADDRRILIKRLAARSNVVTTMDRYELIRRGGTSEYRPLDPATADRIVTRIAKGAPHSSCFIFYEGQPDQHEVLKKTEMEHRYTSTGIKFWRHQRHMESYRTGSGHTVVSTHISPEGACNLKCPYCSVTHRSARARISLGVIKDYVRKLQTRGLKAVILTGGGEPTLYPHINQLVRWLKQERGLSVALITNGTQADRLDDETWKALSWARVSINVFEGWRDRIRLPREKLTSACVIGASFVYTVEHTAMSSMPSDGAALLRQVAAVADECGATYVRILPNCLLDQRHLLAQHRVIANLLGELNDPRFFLQHKIHGTPEARTCHQAYFRPYLSEERWHEDGEPGCVYPCDSLVLNNDDQRFAAEYQICKAGDVLKFLDRRIPLRFEPRARCRGCVFTDNVELLQRWKERAESLFDEFNTPLEHEEFI